MEKLLLFWLFYVAKSNVNESWCVEILRKLVFWRSATASSSEQREQQQHATLRIAPGQLPGVLHLIIMSGCDQPHQRAQASSHETNTSQLVGVPLPKTAVRDF